MKDFASAAKLKDAIDSVHEKLPGHDYKEIEALFPVLAPEYVEAFSIVRDLFTKVFEEDTEPENEDDSEEEEIPDEIEELDEEEEEDDDDEEETPAPADKFPWRKLNPNAKWRKYDGNVSNRLHHGFMLSSDGEIWDIEKHELAEPYWFAGDMRLKVPSDYYCNPDQESPLLRTSIMFCKAFKITSDSTFDNPIPCVVRFVDGDRRNVKPTNLQWVHKDSEQVPAPIILSTIDICQRLVDFNGDIDKTAALYSEPAISRQYIADIRNKLIQVGISDKYFLIDDDGNFVPNEKEVDAAKYYEDTHDAKMAKSLILDKIKNNKPLTEGEKRFLLSGKIGEIRAARDSKRKRQRYTAEVIVDEIRDETGAIISTDLANKVMEEVKNG